MKPSYVPTAAPAYRANNIGNIGSTDELFTLTK